MGWWEILSEPDNSEKEAFDVVLVHGLCRNAKATWESIDPFHYGYAKWFSERVSQSRVLQYNYHPLDNDSNTLCLNGIRREALKLLDALRSLPSGKGNRGPLVFIGHDIGAIIIKEALIQAAFGPMSLRYTYWRTHGIVFLGCPPHISFSDDLVNSILLMLQLSDIIDIEPTKLLAAGLADAVIDINLQFWETKIHLLALIYERYSSHDDSQQRIFEVPRGVIPLALGSSLTGHRIISPLSHLDIPRDVSDESLLRVVSSLSQAADEQNRRARQIMVSRATTPYNLSWVDSASASQLTINRGVLNRSPQFQNWYSSPGPAFISVRGASDPHIVGSVVRDHLISLNGSIEDQKVRMIQCFTFDKKDCRRNSAEAMIWTFLAELSHDIMGHVVTSPGLRKLTADETIPNLKDLSLILYDFLQAEACPELIWLLIDLDQAVIAYQWFLDILMTIADGWESNFKIMVVGNLERNLIQIGAGLQIDYLEPNLSCNEVQLEEKPTPISSGHLDQNTSKPLCRLLETPELLNLQPELNQIFNDLSDPDFLQALQSCLPSLIKNKGVNYAKTALSRLRSGFSVTSFLDQIIQIGSLLTTQDNTSTAAQVLETLEMVIFSLRPLAADELVDLEKAARQWDPSRHERSLDPKSVTSWLPGILILQENEVLFSHRLLRDRILSVDSPVAHFRSGLSENHEFHNGIVKLCLRYLSSPYGGDRLASYTSLGRPSSDVMQLTGPESRQNFLSYAVKYWPIHAKLAGPNLEIFGQPIQEFLGNQDLLNKWALAFWAHQGQGSGHLTGPYAILAQHGLLTMIQEASLKSDHTFGDDQDSQHAFLAAASTGNEAIIGFLAPMVSLNSETFNRAAVALLEFGIDEFAMSSPLSERMAFPNDHGTMALLCRAAFLDEHILIHHVLSIPPSENTQIEINLFGQLLSHACQGGSVQTVKFLLKHRAQEISNKKLLQAMALTVPYSHLSVAKLLAEEIGERMKQESLDIAQGAEAAATDPDKVDLLSGIDIILQLVISRGHYKILQAILDILQPKTSISCLSLPLLKRSIFLARVKCFNVLHEMFIGNHLTIHAFSFKEIISLLETVVQRGEVSILRNLINVGVPFDREFFSGCFAAAINHRYKAADVVDLFISVAKENLDEIALIDELTLHLASAVKSNLPDITKLLIQGGADIDRHTLMSHTRTPLFHAVFEGHLETVIIILSVQPKPDIRSKELHPDGWEPIHAAADNLEILQLLIENKADVNAQTTNGSTALFLAVKWGKIACVKELLRHKPRLDLIVEDNSLLSVGIEYGSEMIELLLDAGVYPCHKDALYANSYLLHECVKNNMLIGLRRLLLFTLPLDQRDEDGRTPLNCLHSTTSVDIVKLLVHRGASPDTIDFSGVSVLFKAVEFGHLATVKFLLSQGVAPDALGGQNETAIHFACINSSLEMVRLLVENCHSLDKIHDGSYGTAFQAACRRYDVESKKELLTYILDTKKVPVNQTSKWWGGNLQMACLLADTTVIQRLLDRGERADEVDRFRRQPIHFASYRTAEHVKILRGKNADILAEDIMHRSVLHFAVSGGNLDLIKYILDEHRELLEQGDCDGWTPIFWALRPRMHWDLTITGRKKIIEELIERGADLERVSAEGKEWTLRQLAQYYGLDQSVVDMFPYKEEYIDEQKLPISKAELNSDGGYCDACLLEDISVCWDCDQCDLTLCFKCYGSSDMLHPEHTFSKFDDGSVDESPSLDTLEATMCEVLGYTELKKIPAATNLASKENFEKLSTHIQSQTSEPGLWNIHLMREHAKPRSSLYDSGLGSHRLLEVSEKRKRQYEGVVDLLQPGALSRRGSKALFATTLDPIG